MVTVIDAIVKDPIAGWSADTAEGPSVYQNMDEAVKFVAGQFGIVVERQWPLRSHGGATVHMIEGRKSYQVKNPQMNQAPYRVRFVAVEEA